MNFLLPLLFIGAIALIVRFYLRKKPTIHVDYSYGNPDLKSVESALHAQQFEQVTNLLHTLDADLQTMAIDHLALSCQRELLQNWVKHDGGAGFDALVLSTHYCFSNWSFEISHSFAASTKIKQTAFTLNNSNSRQHLDLIENSRRFFFAKQLRLIRMRMMNGEIEGAWNHFIAATNQEPNAIFPYLYAAECIQPKWGGDLVRIKKFISMLPEVPVIRMCVMLKLMEDSFLQNENLFGGTMEELVAFANEQLLHIDQEQSKLNTDSPLNYMVYNYVAAVAERLGNKVLKQKYAKRSKGYVTIFPNGPIFREEIAKM